MKDVIINLSGTIARKIRWTPQQVEVTVGKSPPSVNNEPVPDQKIIIQSKTYSKRNGNGHRSEKRRPLNDTEKTSLRARFLRKNGQFKDDDCVRFKQDFISDSINDIGIFQITGFVSYLHREVACGRVLLHNLEAYLLWMEQKYPGLKNFYNNPKVKEVRLDNWSLIDKGEKPNLHIKVNWIRHPVSCSPNVIVTGPPQFVHFGSKKRTM
jgi:hypothetical protein